MSRLPLFLALLCACAAPAATSSAPVPASVTKQPQDQSEVLKLDPRLRHGVMPSGLTYYVLEHKQPEQRAHFWLAVNVGSTLEKDDERGMAHYLEHMAFNGTRHFPKNEIVSFFERAGMRFGGDLNAMTSFDETVYTLVVPTDSDELPLFALRVLRDISADVSLEDEEVERERGVVLEEWRGKRGVGARLFDKLAPVLFNGSVYASRLPIGGEAAIKSVTKKRLEAFYKRWYRPDLMAVIAVGDFSGAAIEKRIKDVFGDLPAAKTPTPRPNIVVPSHKEPLVSVETDPELPVTALSLYKKMAPMDETTAEDYRIRLAEGLYHSALSERLVDIARKPDSPFVNVGAESARLVRALDVSNVQAIVKDGALNQALTVIGAELARIDKFGFSESEMTRARERLLRGVRHLLAEREKSHARALAEEIVRNFTVQEPMPGLEKEIELIEAQAPTLTAQEVKRLSARLSGDSDLVFSIAGPPSMKKPSAAEVLATVNAARQGANQASAEESTAAVPLLSSDPAPGAVQSTEVWKHIGATKWTLKNGMRVVWKPTTFKNDEVIISAFSKGGTSLVKDDLFESARFAGIAVINGGLGALDASALQKALATKAAGIRTSIDELEEQIDGQGSAKDTDTLLQLMYLAFTAPRADRDAFTTWRDQQREFLRNRETNPELRFADEFQRFLTNDHPRRRPLTVESVDKIDLEKMLGFYKERFKNAADFDVVIVGNVEEATLKPLIERYLGSLPGEPKKRETWKDVGVKWPKGVRTKNVKGGSEDKAVVNMVFYGDRPYSKEAAFDLNTVGDLLEMNLRTVLREELGGVYDVGVNASFIRVPRPMYFVVVEFACAPSQAAALQARVRLEMAGLAKVDAAEVDLHKLRESRRRDFELQVKTNGYWLRSIAAAIVHNEPVSDIGKLEDVDTLITAARMRAAAATFLKGENAAIGVLEPASSAPPVR